LLYVIGKNGNIGFVHLEFESISSLNGERGCHLNLCLVIQKGMYAIKRGRRFLWRWSAAFWRKNAPRAQTLRAQIFVVANGKQRDDKLSVRVRDFDDTAE